jgi:hypothetical protein
MAQTTILKGSKGGNLIGGAQLSSWSSVCARLESIANSMTVSKPASENYQPFS